MLWIIFILWIVFALACALMTEVCGNEFFSFLFIASLPIMIYVPFMV